MKQYQWTYHTDPELKADLSAMNQAPARKRLFHIFSTDVDEEVLLHIRDILQAFDPDAEIAGSTSNGNIFHGRLLRDTILITCTVFENPDSQLQVLSFPLDEQNVEEITEQAVQTINGFPWVRAAEILIRMRGMSMTGFCRNMSRLREDIQIFGGGAFSDDVNSNAALVLSGKSGCRDRLVIILYGGKDLHIKTTLVQGWKPLGKILHVTRANNRGRVFELEHRPAYDVYYHYLRIRNDRNFFKNTLEFPFYYDNHGVPLLRAPVSCGKDGSIQMTSDLEEGSCVRIAFGDPETILEKVNATGKNIETFSPQAIFLFSCAARRSFWGDSMTSRETAPFETLADTAGLYTSGEFLRQNGKLQQHNVTLVIASMREGSAADNQEKRHIFRMDKSFRSETSVISRLANLVEVSTKELEETNRRLEKISITDGLTGLYNRMTIQEHINREADRLHALVKQQIRLKRREDQVCLIMLDMDEFKRVNDTWGHQEGDTVLKELASMLALDVRKKNPDASIGRWGGEEFMILLPGTPLPEAIDLAEQLRLAFAELSFPNARNLSISLGVTQILPGEKADNATGRVDGALYRAKNAGRNQVVVNQGTTD